MKNTYLVITSIASHDHPVLKQYAEESAKRDISLIVVGDTKSPQDFDLEACDYYSVERQKELTFKISEILPYNHYARKNLGYLIAISNRAEIIIETDDDNLPFANFWADRNKKVEAHLLSEKGWVNIYKYFTSEHIWPRGFALEHLRDKLPDLDNQIPIDCPIQQGLADENPDVDAIYRLTLPLPITFNKIQSVALGFNTICPFNSQNTTWFKEAFPLLYLPSYCSFRMTDIWRSFVAQRISWTCGWSILFHQSTVWQERNNHSLMKDFKDEISGYCNNAQIIVSLKELNLKKGIKNIPDNMKICYNTLIEHGFVGEQEFNLLDAWLKDIKSIG